MKHGFLIDMDGVLYRGSELITGADTFIRELRDRATPFRLLTNNSQRTRRDVATKLQRLGINVEERYVFTCAMATARFLARQKPGGTAFVIGEGGLLTAGNYRLAGCSRATSRHSCGPLGPRSEAPSPGNPTLGAGDQAHLFGDVVADQPEVDDVTAVRSWGAASTSTTS